MSREITFNQYLECLALAYDRFNSKHTDRWAYICLVLSGCDARDESEVIVYFDEELSKLGVEKRGQDHHRARLTAVIKDVLDQNGCGAFTYMLLHECEHPFTGLAPGAVANRLRASWIRGQKESE